jgi:acetaldehyde dehydrogenase (acetylating)
VTSIGVCNQTVQEAVQFQDLRSIERSAAERHKIHVIDVLPAFCSNEVCPAVVAGRVVYQDDSHITTTYAQALTPYLASVLRVALS